MVVDRLNPIKNEKVLYCEDTIEGVFTAIYDTYLRKLNHDDVKIYTSNSCYNYLLFAENEEIATDKEKATKVTNTIRREFGMACYFEICTALASNDDEKADSVYHMIVHGFNSHYKKNLMNDLSNDYVHNVL